MKPLSTKAAALLAVLVCLPALSRAESKVLVCRDAAKKVQLSVTLDTSGLGMTRQGRVSHPISSAKDISFNCPETPASMASAMNYDVTDPHTWGQDVLQLPKDIAAQKGSFAASLWSCRYDGDWRDAYETALDCSLSAQ